MRKMVLIGGGENGRMLEDGTNAPYNTKEIDEEIVKLTNKENPNFLFINHAMESLDIQESYYQTMKKIYGDIFKCNCMDLKSNELTNEKLVNERLEWADIIYEGGGDTDYMISLWKENHFDKKLYQAYLDGKVISGISAGAICWFYSYNTDSSGYDHYQNGLNWFNYYLCAHANEEGQLEEVKKQLKGKIDKGILLSNCSALEILDNKYKVLKSSNDAFAYQAYYENDEFILKDLEDGFIELNNLES